MHFPTILTVAFAVFSGVFAAEPGQNALHSGFSSHFENAFKEEFGPVAFDALASSSCNVLKCGLTVAKALPCIAECIAGEDPLCIAGCISLSELCSCINCFPKKIVDWLHKHGICNSSKAELFSKAYLGIANDEENRQAQQLGFNPEKFAEL